MIKRTIPISEVQNLPEQFAEDSGTVIVTSQGKPVMAVLPYEEYKGLLKELESLLETVENMPDEEVMFVFRACVEALDRGETVVWEDIKKELGRIETREILQDEELMASFRESVKALERGETVAWEDVKKELERDELDYQINAASKGTVNSHPR